MNTTRDKFPRSVALKVAHELCVALYPRCERLIVAGSLRRRKPTVSDVEILYIPLFETRPHPEEMFATIIVNCATDVIIALEKSGVLKRRLNNLGREMFGQKNKLMRHVPTGIPVDLFEATEENWWNYLVCRTGPAESNVRICTRAQARGWKWNPYGAGFTRDNEVAPMKSEEDVFRFVGLPFSPPEMRL